MKCWIFQRNPTRFEWNSREEIAQALEKTDQPFVLFQDYSENWSAFRYRRELQQGDLVYFWVSGQNGGLEGWGQIRGELNKDGDEYRIPVSLVVLLTSPIGRERVKTGPRMAEHALFTGGAAGANHRCDVAQAEEFNRLLQEIGAPVQSLADAERNLPESGSQETPKWQIATLLAKHDLDVRLTPAAEELLNSAVMLLPQKRSLQGTLSTTTLFFAAVELGKQQDGTALFNFSRRSRQLLADAYERSSKEYFSDGPLIRAINPGIESELDIGISDNLRQVFAQFSGHANPPLSDEILVRALLKHFSSRDLRRGGFLKKFPNFQQVAEDLRYSLVSSSSSHAHSDVWTVEDQLGYLEYAQAIKTFIEDANTRPPMTISIQAPWGGGKSSLMHMLRKELDPWIASREPYASATPASAETQVVPATARRSNGKAGEAEGLTAEEAKSLIKEEASGEHPIAEEMVDGEGGFVTIWFNAWTFQSQQQVWAGLGSAIIKGVTERLSFFEREKFLLRLNLARVYGDVIRQKLHDATFNRFLSLLTSWWALLVPAGGVLVASAFDIWGIAGSASVPLGAVLGGLASIWGLLAGASRKVQSDPVKITLSEYLKVPSYGDELGYVHHVTEDLRRLLEILPREGDGSGSVKPVVLFIDDLDRCSPTKVAEVFEAINLFVAGEFPNCYVILGMDSEIVAAALEKAHEGVIGKLANYGGQSAIGWRFMDKFVQLPLVIPNLSPTVAESFAAYLADEELGAAGMDAFGDGSAKQVAETTEEGDEHDASADEVSAHEDCADEAIHNDQPSPPAGGADQPVPPPTQAERRSELTRRLESQNRNPENIQSLLSKGTEVFSKNPRALKRLTNVFRFYMNLRAAREVNDEDVPSIAQLQNWVILSLGWPDFARWLRRGSKLSGAIGETELLQTGRLLAELEEHLGRPNAKDFSGALKGWRAALSKLSGITADDNQAPAWLADERLYHFFQTIVAEAEDGSLAKGAGKGFW